MIMKFEVYLPYTQYREDDKTDWKQQVDQRQMLKITCQLVVKKGKKSVNSFLSCTLGAPPYPGVLCQGCLPLFQHTVNGDLAGNLA